jgi:hypothetical protein
MNNLISLNEYVNNDIWFLMKYLNMSHDEKCKDIAYQIPYLINDYFDTIHATEDESLIFDDDELEYYEKIEQLEKINSSLIINYGDWLLNRSIRDIEEDIPSWFYLEYRNIVKNQWLVHETKYISYLDILKNGFTYGTMDMSRLGLTTMMKDDSKKYGGFNFAYTVPDYKKYGSFNYGDQVLIFKASGVRCWHNSDEEFQTIFTGNSATNIIGLTTDQNSEWSISTKTGKTLYKNDDINEVINWVVKNYEQYKNII